MYVVIRCEKAKDKCFCLDFFFTKILDGLKMKEASQLSRCPFFTTEHTFGHTSHMLFKHVASADHFAQLTIAFMFLSAYRQLTISASVVAPMEPIFSPP